MVVSHHHGSMRVAQDNLSSHVDELIDKEETALEHLLMEQYTASRLCCHDDEHRYEVGSKSRPRGVGKRHNGAIDKGLYGIMVLMRYYKVVALHFNPHAETAE